MEVIKRKLLGIGQGPIPEGVMNGTEMVPEMLTMIGYNRLTNIEFLLELIQACGIPGDVIEAGVWRGGASIFMRIKLDIMKSRKMVYVADSFRGLPKPDEKYEHDIGDTHHLVPMLSVSLDEVKANFKEYLATDGVVFVEGWFKDTLPKLDATFSLIRLDGDMYESTWDSLVNLYPKLSVGGYCIIDDYWVVDGCKMAVEDYREKFNINDQIIEIDGTGVYWRKSS